VLGSAVYDGLDALHIGLPSAVGTSVRVRNCNTKGYALFAEFAFCHLKHLLKNIYCKNSFIIITEELHNCKKFFYKFSKKLYKIKGIFTILMAFCAIMGSYRGTRVCFFINRTK
jgi:hypothetical protein